MDLDLKLNCSINEHLPYSFFFSVYIYTYIIINIMCHKIDTNGVNKINADSFSHFKETRNNYNMSNRIYLEFSCCKFV